MIEDSESAPNLHEETKAGRFHGIPPWIIISVCGALFILVALIVSWQPSITAIDLEQPWLNTALPPPDANSEIVFTFTPDRDGLSEIEMEIARYGAESSGGYLQFRLEDASGASVHSTLWEPEAQPNQPFTLLFEPESASAGQQYTLTISGSEDNAFAPWGYDLDVLDGSQVSVRGAETEAVDMHFTTRYRLSVVMALVEMLRLTATNAGFLILAFLFILLPGILLLLAAQPGNLRWDPAAWIGVALATGMAAWPLIWQWLSTLGISWSAWALWLVFGLGWLSIIPLYLWRTGWRFRDRKLVREKAISFLKPLRGRHLLLATVLLLGLSLRLLAVRDLAFPAWVDSSRHALITAVMSESGKVITDYSPYLPVTGFPYHYGFHTLSASLEMMTGMELHRLLLIFLQLLISLVPLTVFAGLDLITKRFWAALIAAFLVGIPFLFPGYYVTWGRMTQISAMVILPVGLAFTWLLIRGAKVWRKSWPLLSLLAGGLFLMHFRVFLLYLPFVLMVWILSKGREGRWLAAAAGLSLVLVAPRIFRAVAVLGAPGMSESIPGNNDFPTGYIDPGWELYFLIAAAMSLLLVFVAAARSRRWTWFPLVLALWSALVGLLLSGWIPGISEVPLLNLNSAYITFFLPLAWILAVTFDRIILWLGNRSFAIQVVGWGLTGVLFAALLLYGIHQQINILNPQTILAWRRDESGLRWVEENLPPEAVVAVNSWQWQGSTWAGNDGGAWLIPMTGIKTTTPPVDYIYDEDLSDKVASFNAYASEVEDWSDPAQADWLIKQGVSHIYVGARGGFFDPSELANNPEISEIYRENGVFVFNLR